MFVFAIINSIATLVYLEPPYYGKAYHFFYKMEYNSPGITILASMLPIRSFLF
ncbi:O-antigen polymerase [Leptospira interrogans serovar Canicola]|nr:O-antigen polymerase [Leptospira interrogans serovar Canicola]